MSVILALIPAIVVGLPFAIVNSAAQAECSRSILYSALYSVPTLDIRSRPQNLLQGRV